MKWRWDKKRVWQRSVSSGPLIVELEQHDSGAVFTMALDALEEKGFEVEQ